MRGRYPAGVEYVDKVEGSKLAKERARAILRTMLGELRWQEACQELGIHETRLHQMRHGAVQAFVGSQEPGTAGRPSRTSTPEAERIRELERLLADKDLEVQQAQVREEIALILPQVAERESGKKTRRQRVKLRKLKPR